MTQEQESELSELKAALKQHIEEAEKATPGPWVIRDCNVYQKQGRHIFDFGPHHTPISEYPKSCLIQDEANAAFIAKARTMSPLACRLALEGIEELEYLSELGGGTSIGNDRAFDRLLAILSIWKGGQP